MRRFGRVDKTQAAIVAALRSVGAEVFVTAKPFDLLVAWRGRLMVADCKTPKIGRWTPAQEKDIARFGRHGVTVHRWETPDEALSALGCASG